jgi:hypothetical protein
MEQRLMNCKRIFNKLLIKIKIIQVMNHYPLTNLHKDTHIKIQITIQQAIQDIATTMYLKQINIHHHIVNL